MYRVSLKPPLLSVNIRWSIYWKHTQSIHVYMYNNVIIVDRQIRDTLLQIDHNILVTNILMTPTLTTKLRASIHPCIIYALISLHSYSKN